MKFYEVRFVIGHRSWRNSLREIFGNYEGRMTREEGNKLITVATSKFQQGLGPKNCAVDFRETASSDGMKLAHAVIQTRDGIVSIALDNLYTNFVGGKMTFNSEEASDLPRYQEMVALVKSIGRLSGEHDPRVFAG